MADPTPPTPPTPAEVPLAYLVTVPGGRPDLDETIKYAAQGTPEGFPLKVRIQPTIWTPSLGEYRALSGVSWTVEFRDLETVVGFREALDTFIREWVGTRG